MPLEKKSIPVGKLEWFYREVNPAGDQQQLPVLLLHGLVSQSYSWTLVLENLAQAGFRGIAPDWIGAGFSTKPEKREFTYTPDEFIQALDELIAAFEMEKFHLVVQGFLGSVGLQYALRHPEKIGRLAILNTPISTEAKVPWKIQQLGLPFIGDMLTQDPLLVDRTLEKGSGYTIGDDDLDIYRRPFLQTSAAGRALLATVKNLQLDAAMTEITTGFRNWQHPTLVLWGIADPWLKTADAETFVQMLAEGSLVKLEGAGHYPQEHWSDKISENLIDFWRRM